MLDRILSRESPIAKLVSGQKLLDIIGREIRGGGIPPYHVRRDLAGLKIARRTPQSI